MTEFKNRLIAFMGDRNLKPAELAKKTGLSPARISQYVNGVYIPKHEALEKMAFALGTTPSVLSGSDDSVGVRINKMRLEKNVDINILSIRTDIDTLKLQKIELGVVCPTFEELETISSGLKIDIKELLFSDKGIPVSGIKSALRERPYESDVRPITLKKFRMLGEIACGNPIFAAEEHETYIDASADIKADFCLTARGDSMVGAKIGDGDIVFIKEQPTVENGQIAAVIINDEVTLKRWYFYPEKKKLVLNPENPKYEPLVYVGDELNEIRCLGRAVSLMCNL